MKKFLDRLLLGYILQIPFMVVILGILFFVRFFDSFYNTILIQWVAGHPIPWLGFLISTALSLMLVILLHNQKGWEMISMYLRRYAISRFFTDFIEQWRIFRDLAKTQGVILAPYYRDNSTFYPAIVTGVTLTEHHTYLVNVVFGDLPFPKPFLLEEKELIYTKLNFHEAVAYTLSMGFASKLFKEKLKRETLGEFIRKSPGLIHTPQSSNP